MPKPKHVEPPVATAPPDSSGENSGVSGDVSDKRGDNRAGGAPNSNKISGGGTGTLPDGIRNGTRIEMPNGVQGDVAGERNVDFAAVGKPGCTGLGENMSSSSEQSDSSTKSVDTVIDVGFPDKPDAAGVSLRSHAEEIAIPDARPVGTAVPAGARALDRGEVADVNSRRSENPDPEMVPLSEAENSSPDTEQPEANPDVSHPTSLRGASYSAAGSYRRPIAAGSGK